MLRRRLAGDLVMAQTELEVGTENFETAVSPLTKPVVRGDPTASCLLPFNHNPFLMPSPSSRWDFAWTTLRTTPS